MQNLKMALKRQTFYSILRFSSYTLQSFLKLCAISFERCILTVYYPGYTSHINLSAEVEDESGEAEELLSSISMLKILWVWYPGFIL